MTKGKIIPWDVDRTLCEEVCFTEEEVLKATPIPKAIEKINKQHESNLIVIWTARRRHLMLSTLEWLDKHGINYHAYDFGRKMPFDLYIDADAKRPSEL